LGRGRLVLRPGRGCLIRIPGQITPPPSFSPDASGITQIRRHVVSSNLDCPKYLIGRITECIFSLRRLFVDSSLPSSSRNFWLECAQRASSALRPFGCVHWNPVASFTNVCWSDFFAAVASRVSRYTLIRSDTFDYASGDRIGHRVRLFRRRFMLVLGSGMPCWEDFLRT
jgi:hypothetical protein